MSKRVPRKLLTKEQIKLLDLLKKQARKVSKKFGGDPSKVKVEFRIDKEKHNVSL